MMTPYINELDKLLNNTLDDLDIKSYEVEKEFFDKYIITPHDKRIFYNNIDTLVSEIGLEFNISDDDTFRRIRLFHYTKWAFISLSDLYLQKCVRERFDTPYQVPMICCKADIHVKELSVNDRDWWIENIIYKMVDTL